MNLLGGQGNPGQQRGLGIVLEAFRPKYQAVRNISSQCGGGASDFSFCAKCRFNSWGRAIAEVAIPQAGRYRLSLRPIAEGSADSLPFDDVVEVMVPQQILSQCF